MQDRHVSVHIEGKLLTFAETHVSSTDTSAEMVFVLTDFRPNRNNQAVPIEEKDNIISTALYKPVKIAATDDSWGGHHNASPIGPITSIIDEGDRVVATAVIWKREFPDIYELIKERQDDVYFSWELLCDSVEVIDGISWLRGCEIVGVAIVDDPAYGTRTPLLAIASVDRQGGGMDDCTPTAVVDVLSGDGSRVSEGLSEKLSKNLSEEPTERITQPEMSPSSDCVSSVDDRISDLEEENRRLREQIEQLEELRRRIEQSERLAKRRAAVAACIPSIDLPITDSFLMSLSDDRFHEFCTILTTVSTVYSSSLQTASVQTASVQNALQTKRSITVPDPITSSIDLSPLALGVWLRQRKR